MTQREALVYLSIFNLPWIIFFSLLRNKHLCVTQRYFFVLLLEYVPWLEWVVKEKFINLCVILVSNCSTHVSETKGSQTWRKLKLCRFVCVSLLGLWSPPCRVTLSFLFELRRINKIPGDNIPTRLLFILCSMDWLWSQSSTWTCRFVTKRY